MQAVKSDDNFALRNPRNDEIVKMVRARDLFDKLVFNAWSTGDPGVIFIDEMNRKYPFKDKKVLCTGSCGQYQLESYEGVPYAHIVLPNFLSEQEDGSFILDEDKLRFIVRLLVHFLDNCLDMHNYANEEIKNASLAVRKIGLGIMGFADYLFAMQISYGGSESLVHI